MSGTPAILHWEGNEETTGLLAWVRAAARAGTAWLARRVHAVRPESWFLLLLAVLLLAFAIALFLAPTVGRGGR